MSETWKIITVFVLVISCVIGINIIGNLIPNVDTAGGFQFLLFVTFAIVSIALLKPFGEN